MKQVTCGRVFGVQLDFRLELTDCSRPSRGACAELSLLDVGDSLIPIVGTTPADKKGLAQKTDLHLLAQVVQT